ncbi:UNVERIFIED_CONTAM: putative mitochondrial protein [Sesamum radiatum]|uniref:Mitochondrial protein n=1 Tax=Sesamum radiatum TaxID=300843 RepID=A0AAW2S1B5_SESRA
METKCGRQKIDKLKCKLNIPGIGVESKGKSGGLALLWNKEIFVDLISFSHNHIDAQTLEDCGLHDVPFSGYPFTWANNRVRPHTVRKRLDRACTNLSWNTRWPRTRVEPLDRIYSDHAPISVWKNHPRLRAPNLTFKPRRFEDMWIKSKDCEQAVKDTWNESIQKLETATDFGERLEGCKLGLLKWSKKEFGDTRKRIEPRKLNGNNGESGLVDRRRPEYDIFFTQKLHSKKTNQIERIQDEVGQWCEDSTLVQGVIQCYFHTIFSSAKPTKEDLEEVINVVPSRVSPEMNQQLLEKFIAEEVTLALHQMFPFKSPGPDGMPPHFYQRFWHIVGFHCDVVALVLRVSSVTYSFMLNRSQFGFVQPERVIRHPFSPYLFILCPEAFSCLLQAKENKAEIRGVRVARNAPPVSHLLFADDTLIFCQATNEAMRSLTLGVWIDSIPDKYLGLPYFIGRNKRDLFSFVRNRVWQCISGWKEKFLLQVGKEILIKSIIQSIPSYCMNCFRLPNSLLNELEGLAANFFWNDAEKKKIHWISWGKMCRSKRDGGMGFRKLQAFNHALLAKQGWRIIMNPDHLIFRILKARYFPKGDFLSAKSGYNPSYSWRSLLEARFIIKAGSRWRVRDGSNIRVWKDPWLPRPTTFLQIMPPSLFLPDLRVSNLLDKDNRCWNSELVEGIFCLEDSNLIKSISVSNLAIPDFWVWHFNKNGKFSIKSASHIATKLPWGKSRLYLREHNVVATKPSSFPREVQWQAPINGAVKINFDAAISNKGCGVGVIMRDWKGQCIGWCTNLYPGVKDPEHGEALAARSAVEFAANIHGSYALLKEIALL